MDSQFSASSFFDQYTPFRAQYHARLHNDNFWAVAYLCVTCSHWIQLDLRSNILPIKGIKVQGAGSIQQWVTTLQVETGSSEKSLVSIMETNKMKVNTI